MSWICCASDRMNYYNHQKPSKTGKPACCGSRSGISDKNSVEIKKLSDSFGTYTKYTDRPSHQNTFKTFKVSESCKINNVKLAFKNRSKENHRSLIIKASTIPEISNILKDCESSTKLKYFISSKLKQYVPLIIIINNSVDKSEVKTLSDDFFSQLSSKRGLSEKYLRKTANIDLYLSNSVFIPGLNLETNKFKVKSSLNEFDKSSRKTEFKSIERQVTLYPNHTVTLRQN